MKKYFNVSEWKRTRLRIVVIGMVYLMAMGAFSVYSKMEGLASACVAGVLTIITAYNYGETKRPSEPDQSNG